MISLFILKSPAREKPCNLPVYPDYQVGKPYHKLTCALPSAPCTSTDLAPPAAPLGTGVLSPRLSLLTVFCLVLDEFSGIQPPLDPFDLAGAAMDKWNGQE